ncbi:hypothetical protein CDA63_02620 [Hymenobacter amundsenii]|uniref:Phosphatidic acid phosphatase type 2/haloperoxidase domain-containing protein n=1 Tax=Hymenobacter amundsenii TaxID=2006685 RepID=A0A246FPM0_9BACT|nr:hypothetical protein [Hymenobacter amundsenii]OWP64672.1 hypothetical protein CDA63_02620 [Hymenobacter amundsenii]
MSRFLATVLSVVFHPLLVPFYLFYIVCYQLPGVVGHPAAPDRWLVLAIVGGFTLGLPGLGAALLVQFGYADSLELRQREQRAWPLLLAATGFAIAAGLLHRPMVFDVLLFNMMVGMTLAVLLTLVITLRWKISAHGVGMGGAFGLLLLLHLGGAAGPAAAGWLAGAAAAAVAVGSARLALEAHSPAQVWVGLALGLGVALAYVAVS